MIAAAAAYGAATAYGSAISARYRIPAEPLGVQVPVSARPSLAVGLGAGTAIPWLMAVGAAVAAHASGSDVRHARVCSVIGCASLVGTLVEPVTWHRRAWSASIAATVAANLAASAALAMSGSQLPRESGESRGPAAVMPGLREHTEERINGRRRDEALPVSAVPTRWTPGIPWVHEMTISHRVFRIGLGMLPDLIRSVRPGDRRHAARLRRHFELVAESLERHHRYEDDHFWPVLVERDPTDAPLLHRMESQHAGIADLLAALPPLWDAFAADPGPGTGELLADRMGRLNTVLEQHLDDEEQHLLPVLQRSLSVAEWDAFGKHMAATTPKRELVLIGGLTFQSMTAAEVDDMARHLPAAVWVIRRIGVPMSRRYLRTLQAAD